MGSVLKISEDTHAPNTHQFHPAIATWFEQRFPEGPTEAQIQGWPTIASGNNTLIAAPTGSGKTLAGFLIAIDDLYQRHAAGESVAQTNQVVYVSPLKALATDIAENLERPLSEIAEIARNMGIEPPKLSLAVRTGDTPSHTRAAMLRRPPNFMITTPESLYLLVTAAKSRENLRYVQTVIVDEIHATAQNKRGSHLALTLERLEHVTKTRLTRIGLSATQRPIQTIAELLCGVGNPCAIVDTGHQRTLDINLELIGNDLEAVASQAQMNQVLNHMAQLVAQHHTTLIFVNTRRLSERIAHQLSTRLDTNAVAAHHGSLSTERRFNTEQRLRAGDLKALVATASLELGIDIGPVDLVCQIGSPRSIATFLQRVGRSNHSHKGTPKGRLFPLTRDELIECLALLQAVHQGHLDTICPPVAPLDILVQQIIAETSADNSHSITSLYKIVTKAAPYANLTQKQFHQAVEQASKGVDTGRGTRGAYLHYDTINQEVRGKRGARLAAITSGGAIGENGDYRVLAEPSDTFIGTVNEDWAVESMVGDIFLLGSHSWRIKQVAAGTVKVSNAGDAPPTVPFWLGEAPARTTELSEQVSSIRNQIYELLHDTSIDQTSSALVQAHNISSTAATQAVTYIAATQAALGVIPNHQNIVFERFFDETGGQQLVVHSPYGGRINRAMGLALRKRFCRRFDFELQAAATDNAVILSLGPHHSFPLSDVPQFLHPDSVEEVLQQAVLDSPMFTTRWRWNLNRALVVLRNKSGKRKPPAIQRMEADDIMAAVFPQAAACQENIAGPIHIPNHLLVHQTLHDTLHEALDVTGLKKLLSDIRSGEVKTHFCDTPGPSPFSHEILNAKPYAFLDDGEIADRRTNSAITSRELHLGSNRSTSSSNSTPFDSRHITQITPDAVAQVTQEASPNPRNPDELHDLLTSLVCTMPRPEWQEFYNILELRGRACTLHIPNKSTNSITPDESLLTWSTTELANTAFDPTHNTTKVRGHLDIAGPISADDLSHQTCLTSSEVRQALADLESQGTAMVCQDELWCSRRLLMRMSYLSRHQKRASAKPSSIQDFMRFLLQWQHVTPDTTVRGRSGLSKVLRQLQGLDLPAAAWEQQIIAKRVTDYQTLWLDELCYQGELVWLRLTPPAQTTAPNNMAPRKATPIAFVFRENLPWLLAAARPHPPKPYNTGAVQEIAEILNQRGASFMNDLAVSTHRLPEDLKRALWNGTALGLFTADGFAAVRAMLNRNQVQRRHPRHRKQRTSYKHHSNTSLKFDEAPGRWSLVPTPEPLPDDNLAEAVAQQLLNCWGVVFHDLAHHPTSPTTTPWRDILKALRRFEDQGIIKGGRFVTGQSGEQFALPAAAELLQTTRHSACTNEAITISACDPLNLTGILFEVPRTPATLKNSVTYIDGCPQQCI
ncbi:MAG: DEAD/DEAH box helicase [Acidimicrobiia bacterium]|nr:DEAD/DEAH box helicase [Acidimicrobiia bacterium]MYC57590.1 DEAD/DEAH box helicase [Acidimicrobiia bacterium]MYI31279.1 DEAD/DEAH box helicase [Acidimicrobiia bacterium]